MKMKIKIKGVRNSDLGLRIWGDGSDRTDGTYGTLSYEGQGAGPYREFGIVTGKQIGRASCRERVLRLV